MPAALGAADDRGDPRARARRELHREIADPAGGTGNQHPLAEQRRAVAQAAQRGQPGYRQRRRGAERDLVGNRRHAMRRHRRALGPALPVAQRDDPRAGGGAAAVGRRAHHHPAMSWPGRQPSGRTCNSRNSPRLSEKACTATSASFGPGAGSGTSRIATGAGAVRGVDDERAFASPRRPLSRNAGEAGPIASDGRVTAVAAPSPASGCAGHPLPRAGEG